MEQSTHPENIKASTYETAEKLESAQLKPKTPYDSIEQETPVKTNKSEMGIKTRERSISPHARSLLRPFRAIQTTTSRLYK